MARTAADAEAIKQLAGTSSRGRKLKAPFYHFSLSWSPDEPRPDRVEMRRGDGRGPQVDRPWTRVRPSSSSTPTRRIPHVHVAVCRVDPETGKACGRKNDAKKLSTWAAKYERSRGRVQVPNRIARRQAREEYRAVVDLQVDDRVPVDEAKTKARAVVPLPPMQAKRGAGREARTAAERQDLGGASSRPRSSHGRRRSRRDASGCDWPVRIGGGAGGRRSSRRSRNCSCGSARLAQRPAGRKPTTKADDGANLGP